MYPTPTPHQVTETLCMAAWYSAAVEFHNGQYNASCTSAALALGKMDESTTQPLKWPTSSPITDLPFSILIEHLNYCDQEALKDLFPLGNANNGCLCLGLSFFLHDQPIYTIPRQTGNESVVGDEPTALPIQGP